MNRGQTTLTVIMWAIGLMSASALGMNLNDSRIQADQDTKISALNREIGELKSDISYIRGTVEEIKLAQQKQFQVQGIKWVIASSSCGIDC